MAFEAVDACFGTPHISSDDLAALNTATVGKADCVLHYGDDFKAVMSSANECLIGTGVGMVGGRRFWNQAATSLTIKSGTQGQKRNDLVVARYAKTSAGIESITPVVVKGTPSTGTAADPATTSNDLKLWRIPLDGISVGTPVRLFDPVASLATLGDSVSQARINWKVPYSNSTIQLERIGRAVFCHGNVKFNSSGQCNYSTASEILPKGFRPLGANTPAVFSLAGNFALLFDENGKVSMFGNPNNAYASCTGSWVTGDPFPA